MNYRVSIITNHRRQFIGHYQADDGEQAICQAECEHMADESARWIAESEPLAEESGE